jgi:beta-1,4-N-acetylglucosaminyltransferase
MILLVTVGTTKFDALIEEVASKSFQSVLCDCGYTQLIVQYGSSNGEQVQQHNNVLSIEKYDYKSSILEDLKKADTIISSGGSGTILESMEAEKDLIIVPNESLQDNHQLDLCNKLASDGYITKSTIRNLGDTLKEPRATLKWPKANGKEIIARIVMDLME